MAVKDKILVIVGPTASGKSALAIEIAKKIKGEVISADSRQVYKGMDLGTGKVTKKEMRGVPHHMLDVVSPKSIYTVDKYKKAAEAAIEKVISKGKVPIICGGTGFYIDALVYDQVLPDVQPNKFLREKLSKQNTEKLFAMLTKKDPERAKTIDRHNKIRLIRALEIIEAIGKVPTFSNSQKENELSSASMRKRKYDFFIFGIKIDQKKLEAKIKKRLLSRIKSGMIKEIDNLRKQGISWKRMETLGLEYRYVSRFLRGLISKEEMVEQLHIATCQYSKRQMTWFKRNKEITWIGPSDSKKIVSAYAKALANKGGR